MRSRIRGLTITACVYFFSALQIVDVTVDTVNVGLILVPRGVDWRHTFRRYSGEGVAV